MAAVFGLIPIAAILGLVLLLVTWLAPRGYSGITFVIGLMMVFAAGILYVQQRRQRPRGRT